MAPILSAATGTNKYDLVTNTCLFPFRLPPLLRVIIVMLSD